MQQSTSHAVNALLAIQFGVVLSGTLATRGFVNRGLASELRLDFPEFVRHYGFLGLLAPLVWRLAFALWSWRRGDDIATDLDLVAGALLTLGTLGFYGASSIMAFHELFFRWHCPVACDLNLIRSREIVPTWTPAHGLLVFQYATVISRVLVGRLFQQSRFSMLPPEEQELF